MFLVIEMRFVRSACFLETTMKKKLSKEQQRLIDFLDKAIAEYTAKYGNDYEEWYEMMRQERTNL